MTGNPVTILNVSTQLYAWVHYQIRINKTPGTYFLLPAR
jgi:hypothetical protein